MVIEEILLEARRRYPIGTKFKGGGRREGVVFEVKEQLIIQFNNISHPGIDYVYYEGKWADIISSPKSKIIKIW